MHGQVTTTDQETAEVGKEPLRTLQSVRSGKALDWTQEKAWRAQAFFGWLCEVQTPLFPHPLPVVPPSLVSPSLVFLFPGYAVLQTPRVIPR